MKLPPLSRLPLIVEKKKYFRKLVRNDSETFSIICFRSGQSYDP